MILKTSLKTLQSINFINLTTAFPQFYKLRFPCLRSLCTRIEKWSHPIADFTNFIVAHSGTLEHLNLFHRDLIIGGDGVYDPIFSQSRTPTPSCPVLSQLNSFTGPTYILEEMMEKRMDCFKSLRRISIATKWYCNHGEVIEKLFDDLSFWKKNNTKSCKSRILATLEDLEINIYSCNVSTFHTSSAIETSSRVCGSTVERLRIHFEIDSSDSIGDGFGESLGDLAQAISKFTRLNRFELCSTNFIYEDVHRDKSIEEPPKRGEPQRNPSAINQIM
jgi:hypothetical protein